jgi:uncharacterized protein (TIGR03083 family)
MSLPGDLTLVADAYRSSRLRMQELAAGLDAETAARTVPACPDWDVRDLLSHVTGIATDLSAGRRPENGDTQGWVDRQVEERRDRTAAEVSEEWSTSGPAFEAMIEAAPQRLWGLTYDLVVHEMDLRGAIGDRGGRDSDDVALAAQLGLRLVAMDLDKAGLPAFRAVIDGTEHVVGDGAPGLMLTGSAYDVLRLLGSRRTIDQLRAADFEGDLDRYLAGILHMDPPSADLGE